ncbi:beta-1,3-galactosyltransferase 1 [Lingula anatina]|uniref:Hexosyltransferase n=1 Tax=Lingula anatina TaxID=7574 RepID=A0A1S3HYH6_LINAN|nr:beta-1,3-galactosyltransferase 1 [Lingula anatina]|eukprot:XP_013390134.1 beta-1,3-galactosyltransferase 1 [Lingula anatina]
MMARRKIRSYIYFAVKALGILMVLRLISLLFHAPFAVSRQSVADARHHSYATETAAKPTGRPHRFLYTPTEKSNTLAPSNDIFRARTKALGLYQISSDFYGKHSVAQLVKSHKLFEEGANPHDFRYIIQPKESCKDTQNIYMTIIVSSHPSHSSRRNIIRNTWGNPKTFEFKGILTRTIFVMGLSRNSTTNWALLEEGKKFNDIVLEDFLTEYKNMTYAHIAGFKWIATYCNQSKWTIKTDDDVYVNIFQAISFQEKNKLTGDFIAGAITTPAVYRRGGKWRVTKSEYIDDRYQTYPMGYGYMTTTNLVSKMYTASISTPFYWIDDVYVGILAAKVGGVRFRRTQTNNWLGKNVNINVLANNGALFTHLEARHVSKATDIFKKQNQTYHQGLKRR